MKQWQPDREVRVGAPPDPNRPAPQPEGDVNQVLSQFDQCLGSPLQANRHPSLALSSPIPFDSVPRSHLVGCITVHAWC